MASHLDTERYFPGNVCGVKWDTALQKGTHICIRIQSMTIFYASFTPLIKQALSDIVCLYAMFNLYSHLLNTIRHCNDQKLHNYSNCITYGYIYIYISTSPRLSVKYYHDAPHPSHTSTISIDITNIVQPYFNPEFHEVSVSRIIWIIQDDSDQMDLHIRFYINL